MNIPKGLDINTYIELIKNSTIRPRFKFEFLNNDNTVKFEVEEDIVKDSGSINISFNKEVGSRRSCNIVLTNIDKAYLPNPNGNIIWMGSLFKLSLGVEDDNGVTYWSPNGVYVVNNPVSVNTRADKSLKITGVDKWANLDGSLNGELTESYEVTIGSNVYSVIQAILDIDKGNNEPLDMISPIFDSSNKDSVTSYTIREEQGGTYGSLISKLCQNITSYAYYNENGQLVLENGTRDLGDNLKGSIYDFDDSETEILSNTITYNFNKVRNSIRVVGSNINGDIATGLAENTNPSSSTRVNLIGKRSKVVRVDTIDTDNKALDYASLLLKTDLMLNVSYNISCTYMTHLDVNEVMTITSEYYGFENERFLIQSVSVPLSIGSEITIQASNVSDLPFS